MHTIFLVVGESGSGKDSLINMICNEIGLKQLKSYTTRPRRENEHDTHVFISPDDVEQYKNDIIAYTKIGAYEYFATKSQLNDADLYAIDYEGIKYLRDVMSNNDNLRFVIIYINVPRKIREERATTVRGDDQLTFYRRCFNEEVQFNEMLVKRDFDYMITNRNLNTSYHIFKQIVLEERHYD